MGSPRPDTLGRRAVRLYPIFHPAAALYTPRMLETLREDFARLPELLALPVPEQPAPPTHTGVDAGREPEAPLREARELDAGREAEAPLREARELDAGREAEAPLREAVAEPAAPVPSEGREAASQLGLF